MRLEFSKQKRVPVEQARERALQALRMDRITPPALVADAIWPDHEMRPQGAAGAASRILKRLERDGLARTEGRTAGRGRNRTWSWGWVRTAAGETAAHGTTESEA